MLKHIFECTINISVVKLIVGVGGCGESPVAVPECGDVRGDGQPVHGFQQLPIQDIPFQQTCPVSYSVLIRPYLLESTPSDSYV